MALSWPALAAAASVTATIPVPSPPRPPDLASRDPIEVRVLQGDLLWIAGRRVRLAGIASIDRAQRCQVGGGFVTCGAKAAETLSQAVAGRNVRCTVVGEEASPYVRDPPVLSGLCQADGADLAAIVLAAGYAVSLPASGYRQMAMEACAARRGAWVGYVESPLTFRPRRSGASVAPVFIGAGARKSCLAALPEAVGR